VQASPVRQGWPTWAWSAWRLLLFAILFVALAVLAAVAAGPVLVRVDPIAELFIGSVIMLLAAVLAGVVLLRVCDARGAAALGFAWTRATGRELTMGVGIGAAALSLAVGILVVAGWLRFAPADGTAGAWVLVVSRDFAVLGVAAAAEEAIFRGYPFQVLVAWLGATVGTVVSSAAFALAHARNPEVDTIALVNIFLAGVLLALAYLRTRSLWFATAVHLGWNWAMASWFDLPVSGFDLFETPLYDARLYGPEWVTGGAFGPEAGLLATLAFAGAAIAIARWPRIRPAPEQARARPLVAEHAAHE
jgi:uncharacterized protein